MWESCGQQKTISSPSSSLLYFLYFLFLVSLFFFDMVNLLLDDFLVAVAVSSTSISSVRSSLHLVVAIFHCIGFRSTFQLMFFCSFRVPGYVESDMWVHSMTKFSAVRSFPWGRFFFVFRLFSSIYCVVPEESNGGVWWRRWWWWGWRCERGDGEQLSNMCVMCTEFSWAIELEIWCVRCCSSPIYRFIIKFPLLPLLAWQWNDIRSENAIMMHFFRSIFFYWLFWLFLNAVPFTISLVRCWCPACARSCAILSLDVPRCCCCIFCCRFFCAVAVPGDWRFFFFYMFMFLWVYRVLLFISSTFLSRTLLGSKTIEIDFSS